MKAPIPTKKIATEAKVQITLLLEGKDPVVRIEVYSAIWPGRLSTSLLRGLHVENENKQINIIMMAAAAVAEHRNKAGDALDPDAVAHTARETWAELKADKAYKAWQGDGHTYKPADGNKAKAAAAAAELKRRGIILPGDSRWKT